MYTVYRSWIEPDVLIRVGVGEDKREFKGPRKELSEQSGYLKSLLEAADGNEISVPNINPPVFASILRFVNTGYLDLNSENIYAVLLATHLLHMPRAVDICRSYLMRDQTPQRLPTLVKPIPSRKFLPTLYWPPPPPPILPPPPFCHLTQTPTYDPLPSTSILPTFKPTSPSKEINLKSSENSTTKNKEIVKDIACCDGPVRFKRVLNENYGFMSEQEGKFDEQNVHERKQLFVCSFCKHTFKSHYCYRKHTRRHINPIIQNTEKECKDMNVQYYPCKTCGSKFPSYYFVHKHRKTCQQSESTEDKQEDCPN